MFCKTCHYNYIKNDNLLNENLEESSFLNELSKKEVNEILFLNSISIIIKRLLIETNYLIKRGKIDSEEEMFGSKEIKIVYPFINSTPDFDSCLNFVKNTILFFKDFSKKENIDHKNFITSKLDNKIINQLKSIFKEKNQLIPIDLLNDVDDLYSFNSSYQDLNCMSMISEENNIEYISSQRYLKYIKSLFDSKKTKDLQNKNKLNQIDENKTKQKSENHIKRKRENLSYLEYTYLIEILSLKVKKRNNSIEEEIIRKMKTFYVDNHFLKYLFFDFLITTETFFNLTLKEIIFEFPSLNELYLFKILIDDLIIKELGLKDYIDNNGNILIIGKKTYKFQGNKKYLLPPSGWAGVGIKIDKECNNDDEWSNFYLAFGKNLSSNDMKEKLKELIKNGFKKDELKNGLNDHIIKISKYFNKIEVELGTISFYNKIFKIALMVKIKKETLKKLGGSNFALLNNDNLKIYSLLLKKN